jgi:tRNA modification GTPase
MVDTIFAQASARGQAGVAVVRISGPLALTAAADLAGGEIPPRRATVRWLRDPGSGERLDQAVVLAFPAPASFTGENVAELQVHGSQAVVSSLLAVLGRMPGLRPAEPGEFTRRALINERLDLAQVEGLADLLAAETAAQRRQALELMDGALSRKAADWGRRLTEALAFVEASIDFADEELPTDLLVAVRVGIGEVYAAMQQDLAGSRMAERIRDGFEVALVGRPNVGKSTLLNALAGREAALTSEIAGTTRDVIELRMELDGLAITLLDMAGLREASGRVEALGVERARARAARADLRVLLVVVLAKADLRATDEGPAVSGATGAGIDGLLSAISTELGARSACAGSLSHQRQREAIERAAAAVANAGAELGRGEPRVELVAEDLRAALRALDFLVGKVDVEALLDVIFQSFCLGK